jgi:D-glycero-alpha-D-manno-heptose-7-phosphate kinase
LIDQAYAAARGAGALGGKLLGAGGGGFLLVYAPPAARERVIGALRPLAHVPFRFESDGTQLIYHQG